LTGLGAGFFDKAISTFTSAAKKYGPKLVDIGVKKLMNIVS